MKNKNRDLHFITKLNQNMRDVIRISCAFAEHKRDCGLDKYEKIVFENAMADIAQASHKLLWLAVLSPQSAIEKKLKIAGCK